MAKTRAKATARANATADPPAEDDKKKSNG
jgi:hypothetical protein